MLMQTSEFAGYNVAESLNLADENRVRNRQLRNAAQDPSERTKQCIAFLFTVERIEVADTVKNSHGDNSFLINVFTNDTSNKSEATAMNFQIQRTFKEFKTLHKTVEHWADKHPYEACSYCKYFLSADLPGGFSRLTMSKQKLEKQLEGFLSNYVAKSRLPRSGGGECQGFDHISSIVTRFLLKDMPPPETTEAQEGNQDTDAATQ